MSTATLNRTNLAATSLDATPSSELRLTRRGRLVVLATALLVLMICGVVLAAGSVATSEKGSTEPTETIVVGTGDTLWDIAAARSDDGDVQATIDHIMDLNDLDSAMVAAGTQLVVPTD